MDLINNTTTEESVNATFTEVIIQYMGTTEQFQKKIDKGLTYLKWMLAFMLLVLIIYIGSETYRAIYPPPTEIDRKWIIQQQRSIAEQQEYLSLQQKQINKDKVRNTTDAIVNLRITESNSKDRVDIAIARSQFTKMQENSIQRDSLFNQKRPFNAKTINAEKVNTVNSKTTKYKRN